MSNILPRPDICHVFPSLTPDTRRCIFEHLEAKTEAKCLMVTSAAYAQTSSKKRLADLRAYDFLCLLTVALDSAPCIATHPLDIAEPHFMSPSDSAEALKRELESAIDDLQTSNARIKHLLCSLEDDPRHSCILSLLGTVKLLRRAHAILCDEERDVQLQMLQKFLRLS